MLHFANLNSAMKTIDHSTNGASPKNHKTRVIERKITNFFFLNIMIVFSLSFMVGCNPEDELQKDESTGVENTGELHVVKLNPETDHFDLLVAGTDSVNAVVNMNWQTSTPKNAYLSFYDDIENGLFISFRSNGLPDYAVYNDVVIIYDNFQGNKCDITVIKPNKDSRFIGNVECKLDWDKLIEKQSVLKSATQNMLRSTTQDKEAVIAISHSLKFISNASGAAICGVGIAGLFTGVGTVPSVGLLAVGCGSALVGVTNDYLLSESNLYVGLSASGTSATATLVGCAKGVSSCVLEILVRMLTPAAMAMSIAEEVVTKPSEDNRPQIYNININTTETSASISFSIRSAHTITKCSYSYNGTHNISLNENKGSFTLTNLNSNTEYTLFIVAENKSGQYNKKVTFTTDGSILGEWNCSTNGPPENDTFSISLKENGIAAISGITLTGTWNLDDNKVVIKFTGQDNISYTLTGTINGDKTRISGNYVDVWAWYDEDTGSFLYNETFQGTFVMNKIEGVANKSLISTPNYDKNKCNIFTIRRLVMAPRSI